MPITNHLPELLELRRHELDANIAGLQEAIQVAGDGLIDLLIDVDINQWQGQVLTKQVVWLQQQLRGQLNKLGWQDLADKFVSFYDEAELFGKTVVKALGRSDAILHPMRQDTIRQLRDLDLSAFNEFGNHLITSLSKEVALNTLIGKPRGAMIRSLTQVMNGEADQAKLFVDTAVRVFDRTANGELWTEAGITHFKYFGPSDNVTRPFCAAHVGKVYPLSEIKKMSNGSARYSDVWRFGGGPRCRHTWSPVVEPEAAMHQQEHPSQSPPPEVKTPHVKGPRKKMPSQIEMLQQMVDAASGGAK